CCQPWRAGRNERIVNARLSAAFQRFGAKRQDKRMPLVDQISKDMTQAMRDRSEHRLSTLRMVKTALKNREIEKRGPLEDREAQQVLSTLIKQRRESVEQFQKGGRPELAQKEAAEIEIIEAYMPKAAGA